MIDFKLANERSRSFRRLCHAVEGIVMGDSVGIVRGDSVDRWHGECPAGFGWECLEGVGRLPKRVRSRRPEGNLGVVALGLVGLVGADLRGADTLGRIAELPPTTDWDGRTLGPYRHLGRGVPGRPLRPSRHPGSAWGSGMATDGPPTKGRGRRAMGSDSPGGTRSIELSLQHPHTLLRAGGRDAGLHDPNVSTTPTPPSGKCLAVPCQS